MRGTIVARRYAKALFAVVKEEGAFEEYTEKLNGLAELVTSRPEILDGLTNPLYPLEIRAKVMEHLGKAVSASTILGNFLNLLVQKKRSGLLPEIAASFQKMVDVEQNVSRGLVISATELSPELTKKVQATLEKITAQKVILTTRVDQGLIGGMIAQVGDLVMDGSIKTQLTGLKESIKGSE